MASLKLDRVRYGFQLRYATERFLMIPKTRLGQPASIVRKMVNAVRGLRHDTLSKILALALSLEQVVRKHPRIKLPCKVLLSLCHNERLRRLIW